MAYSKLTRGADDFTNMMNEFGIVTVMNVEVYEIDDQIVFKDKTASEIRSAYKNNPSKLLTKIDTLKIANINIEGPNKTVTGGQYSNPLIKFGKSARLEMQDALGRSDAIEAFGGAVNEFKDSGKAELIGMHITEDFAPARLMIGESFFISKKTGQQVKVDIIFYQVLPDSIFNLTQDPEGDASVFDMNADLLTTDILVGHKDSINAEHGVFYSILPHSNEAVVELYSINEGKIVIKDNYTGKLDGVAVVSGTTTVPSAGEAGLLVIYDNENNFVASYILSTPIEE